MNIIEQAARRLDQLRRSGIDVAPAGSALGAGSGAALPARAAQRLQPAAGQRAVHAAAPAARPSSRSPSKPVEIDLKRLAAMGYLTPETLRAQIAEEFRVIKRPLLNNVRGKSAVPVERANLIMVTSSMPGEGKTFVSVNLAISIAMEIGKQVLLVDADVSRPSVLSRLGLRAGTGLLDVLDDASAADVSDVLLHTNIEALTLMPAGAPRSHATELLASPAMIDLLDEMASRYADRILVFDAPPLLCSTESRVLATHMGQVVVVVEAERTPQKTLAQALATVESCPVVMPLLNKASLSEMGFYYGYYGPVDG